MINSGGSEVGQQVGGVRGRDAHTHVLSEVAVVVVQLVTDDPVTPRALTDWLRPHQLDRVGGAHLALEVSRRTDICQQTPSSSALQPFQATKTRHRPGIELQRRLKFIPNPIRLAKDYPNHCRYISQFNEYVLIIPE